MSYFSKKLKYHISKMKLNTVSLGEKMDVSAGAIGFWQNGSRFPKSPETIERLMDILDVTAVDLFDNTEENKRKITINELKNNFGNYLCNNSF